MLFDCFVAKTYWILLESWIFQLRIFQNRLSHRYVILAGLRPTLKCRFCSIIEIWVDKDLSRKLFTPSLLPITKVAENPSFLFCVNPAWMQVHNSAKPPPLCTIATVILNDVSVLYAGPRSNQRKTFWSPAFGSWQRKAGVLFYQWNLRHFVQWSCRT